MPKQLWPDTASEAADRDKPASSSFFTASKRPWPTMARKLPCAGMAGGSRFVLIHVPSFFCNRVNHAQASRPSAGLPWATSARSKTARHMPSSMSCKSKEGCHSSSTACVVWKFFLCVSLVSRQCSAHLTFWSLFVLIPLQGGHVQEQVRKAARDGAVDV
jgi:hypothetical protein